VEAINSNSFPLFQATCESQFENIGGEPSIIYQLEPKNVGGAPAFNCRMKFENKSGDVQRRDVLTPGETIPITIVFPSDIELDDRLVIECDSAIGVSSRTEFVIRARMVRGPSPGLETTSCFSRRQFFYSSRAVLDIQEQ
jgi:hypothetical protein